MRLILAIAAVLLLLPTASAGLVQDAVCAAEDAATGGDAACDEVNGRTVPYGQAFCAVIWFFAEQPQPACGAFTEVAHEGETYYVSLGPYGMYRESNGCPGLQQAPGDCDGDGSIEPADAYVTLEDYA